MLAEGSRQTSSQTPNGAIVIDNADGLRLYSMHRDSHFYHLSYMRVYLPCLRLRCAIWFALRFLFTDIQSSLLYSVRQGFRHGSETRAQDIGYMYLIHTSFISSPDASFSGYACKGKVSRSGGAGTEGLTWYLHMELCQILKALRSVNNQVIWSSGRVIDRVVEFSD